MNVYGDYASQTVIFCDSLALLFMNLKHDTAFLTLDMHVDGSIAEIAQNEQFLLWPQCFQLYFTIKLSFLEIFQVFVTMFSKSSAAVCGKGLINAHLFCRFEHKEKNVEHPE